MTAGLLVDINDRNVSAGLRERPRVGTADALPTARDQSYLPVEPEEVEYAHRTPHCDAANAGAQATNRRPFYYSAKAFAGRAIMAPLSHGHNRTARLVRPGVRSYREWQRDWPDEARQPARRNASGAVPTPTGRGAS